MLFFYSESCYSHNSFPLTHNLLQLHVFMLVQTTNAGSSTDRTGAQQCVSKIPAQTHLKTGHSTAIHTNTQMVWCNQCSDPPRPDRDASKLPSGDLLTLSNLLKSLPLSSVSHHISSSSLTHLTDIQLEGLVHPIMKIMSLSTHTHVVPNLRSSSEHKLRYFCWNRRAIWHSIDSKATEFS